MFLLQIISKEEEMTALVNAIDKLAKLQSEKGEWSVNGAAFIVIAVLCIITLGSVFGLLIKSILNQQKQLTKKVLDGNDLLSKFQVSFDKNTEVLEKVGTHLNKIEEVERERFKRETTAEQLNFLVQNVLTSTKFNLVENTLKIIEQNNIINTVKTNKKVMNLVTNLINSIISGLNNFDFQGKKVGDLMNSDKEVWRVKQSQIITEYIYSDSKDLLRFHNDLNILFDFFSNQIKEKFTI